MTSRLRIRPRHRRAIALIAALALMATACQVEDWAPGGTNRPFWCDPTDTAINDGHGGGGHEPHYTEEKGPLSAAECMVNHFYLAQAERYAAQFPTKGYAEANGWHWLAPWIPGQGTHHVNVAQGVSSAFDPARPNMLMFDGNGANAPLTGMVFVVRSGHMPPAGFAGNNDHWHFHEKLCYQYNPDPFIVGDGITDSECAARGGVNVDSTDTWLLHVWLPEYDGWQATDIFNKTHPGI